MTAGEFSSQEENCGQRRRLVWTTGVPMLYSAEHRQGDLGYAVHPDHWGKGFATEALRRILEFGFENLSLERIWATADVRNVASWRVMEKAGRTHAPPPACPWCVAGFCPLCSHQRYVTVALIC